ncbi:alpha/beta hydrolase [Pyxidicoccus fallax]|uniref:Alpha/beta hydrolase n=1 Tax=Pyxidicoccus fallax TaxID=394095 RepID=A0A848LL50_9BACT|nr:alpha/beta hydrolase [Pyxidicoccus fallax]NMO18468.1 alpha/beta hydrolase [Pyxidicoccus fallax]NPC81679.1 alpha/beta hydrolase [Pyxidicoccus fallax]
MRRHVLITGSASLLASQLAAQCLASSEDTVLLRLRRPDGSLHDEEELHLLVRHAVPRLPGPDTAPPWEALRSRLHCLPEEEGDGEAPFARALPASGRIDEAWYVCGGYRPAPGARADTGGTPRHLLSALSRLGVLELNHVGPWLAPGEATDFAAHHRAQEREVVAACAAAGVGSRLFRTSPVLGPVPALRGPDREGGLQLLEALHDLQAELGERTPDYLAARPLRCWAPAGASVALVHVGQAARRLWELARAAGTVSRGFHVTASERLPFTRLCEQLGAVYGMNLQATAERASLNAVDRGLQERLGGFQDGLTASGGEDPAFEEVRLDGAARPGLLQEVRASQDAARAGQRARAATLFDTLGQRTVERGGSRLTYFAGGTGDVPLVLLNALGQGLFYWKRLMSCLLRRHRVLVWEPRGTESGPQPFLMGDQVDDLEAILRNEGVGSCHLVGWCTGPKVAVEFYLRHPDRVASMVFLNGSFRCSTSPKTHQTAYEANFEPLCGLLVRRPAMAGSVLKSLRLSMSQEEGELKGLQDAEAASRALARMNGDLKPHVLGPFRSEPVIVNYARQIVDFWSYDLREKAARVHAPVLLVSAEHDAVASPETSREMAQRLPNARHVHVQGATHYCMYDRPEFIAELIEEFLRNPTPTRALAAVS